MRFLLVLALSCALLASCGKSDSGGSSGGGSGGGSAASSGKDGGDTPQGVFDRAKAAMGSKNFGELFACVEPARRDELTFMFVVMAGFVTMGDDAAKKEFEDLCKKHGVAEQKEGDPPVDMNDKAKMKEAIAKSFANVKDRKALFADVAKFTESHSKEKDSLWEADATLKDVKEDGSKATGKVVKKDGKEKEVKFVKADGRWYLELE